MHQHACLMSSLAAPTSPTVMRTGDVSASRTMRSTFPGIVALNSSVCRSGRVWPRMERTYRPCQLFRVIRSLQHMMCMRACAHGCAEEKEKHPPAVACSTLCDCVRRVHAFRVITNAS